MTSPRGAAATAAESGALTTAMIAARVRSWAAQAGPALGEVALPFVLVFSLGLAGGGYDVVIRSEVGIAVWWALLLGALVGALPAARIGAAGWIGLGLLGSLFLWTALAISWSESSERSVIELGRISALLGVLALALAAGRPGSLRRVAWSVGAAIGVLSALALLSRLNAEWLPASEGIERLSAGQARLNWPLDYWNGLAALVAMGIPLLVHTAAHARGLLAQALAAASLPVLALTAFFTFSRGGAGEIAIALVVLFCLHPRRVSLLPTVALGAASSAILIAAATQRDALERGLVDSELGRSQGDEMLAMVVVVCAGVALSRAAIGLARRHGLGPRLIFPRRAVGFVTASTALISITAAVALGLSGALSERWAEFKDPAAGGPEAAATTERFESASGRGRYQYWESALDANASDPLKGIGPGTFEYWWARNGTRGGFVRDAHSLYLETLGELGIVGFALVVLVVIALPALGAAGALRAPPETRAVLAAAIASCAAFAAAAAIDWAWELTVLPVALMVLLAGILRERRPADDRRSGVPWRAPTRGLVALAAVGGIIAIAIPAAGASKLRQSQDRAASGALEPALAEARSAIEIQPYAASPALQEALLLELRGDLSGAARAAQAATADEPTNWRTWLVLSRIEARSRDPEAAIEAYRRARALNPRSPLFQPPP